MMHLTDTRLLAAIALRDFSSSEIIYQTGIDLGGTDLIPARTAFRQITALLKEEMIERDPRSNGIIIYRLTPKGRQKLRDDYDELAKLCLAIEERI